MNFQYTCTVGEITPTQISYTGNAAAGLGTYAKVTFQYITDPCLNSLWVGGHSITVSRLLSSITVCYGSDTIRSYCFEYDHDRSSRLTGIVLKDGTGTELTRTDVKWGDDLSLVSPQAISGLQGYNIYPGDFTGDNIEDLFLYEYDPNTTTTTWQVKKGDGEGGYTTTTLSGTLSGYANPDRVSVADFNGNGLDDIGCVLHVLGTNNYSYQKILFTGAGFSTSNPETNQTGLFFPGNFKGLGQIQVLTETSHQGNYITLDLENENISLTVPSTGYIRVTDLNGNGKSELFVKYGNYIDVYEYDEATRSFVKIVDEHWMSYSPDMDAFGDFNGDGMQDYVFVIGTQTYMKISKGNDYTPAYHMEAYDGISSQSKMLVGDLNGDGKDDIVRLVYNSTYNLTLKVFYTRDYHDTIVSSQVVQFQNNLVSNNTPNMYHFTDLNRDGKNELFYTGSIYDNPVVISFPERREHDFITSVTNGLGMTTSLEYSFYNTPGFSFLGVDGKRIHYPLVNKMTRPDGIGGDTETAYSYGEAIFDYARTQFLGFRYHKTRCNGTNTKLEFEYDSTYHYLNLVHTLVYYRQSSRDDPSGYIPDNTYWNQNQGFSHYEIVNTPGFHDLSYGRFVPYFSITSTINRLENIVTTSYSWLNAEGRVSKSSIHHRKAKTENSVIPWISRDSTEYTFTTVTLPNGKTAVKPSTVQTWNIRNGFTQMPWRKNSYAYSSGRLARDTVTDSDGPVGVTSYTYNSVGWPVTETYKPNGLNERTKTYGYDHRGRFLTQVTDVLGHTQSATFNKYTGTKTTETDVNNLTTTYQYDDFGRLVTVTRPDQTVHHISYRWYNGNHFGNAVFYRMETETGTPERRTYYDILGRAIHNYSEDQGYHDMVYDARGRMVKTTFIPYTAPSVSSSYKTWHNYEYDDFDRIVAEDCPYTDLSYSYYDATDASQHDYYVSVVDNIRDVQQTKAYDALGRPLYAKDEGGTISYSYAYETVSGMIRDKVTVSLGSVSTVVVSDIRGNRLSIQDPDAGTVTSTYNALNQLISRTDANGNQTSYNYDLAGRTIRTVYSDGADSEVLLFTYDNASGKGIGKLASVQNDTDTEYEYAYDNLGRLATYTVYDGHDYYEHLYEYDNLGRLQYLTYPDGFRIKHYYTIFGELSSIYDASDNNRIFEVFARNDLRQPTTCVFGNGTGTQYTYNAYGMVTGIRNGNAILGNNVQSGGSGEQPVYNYIIEGQYRNLYYTYDNRGFIETKRDTLTGQSEAYGYDDLDRLDSYKVNGITAGTFTYGNNGNIEENTRIGRYSYSSSKPHAVTAIDSDPRIATPPSLCEVTYNMRNRPDTIQSSGYRIVLDYDASTIRRHTTITNGQTLVKQKTRISDLYEQETASNSSRRLDYIYFDGQIVAVHVDENSTEKFYYVLTDHLGSWEKVLDENKNTVQQTHFDPWGNRMSYTAWNTPQTQTSFTLDRGFTGHEHYDCIHVINANARLYDPVIGRFFSPDPFVQAPDFTQNYNRYSYCMNNPVMFSDPDGEFFWIPVIAGAMVGAFFGGIRADQKGEDFLLGMVKGAFVGGLGGVLGGIGGSGMSFAENLFLGTWEGGFTGYVDGLVWGEDPGKNMLYGMASGALLTTLTSEHFQNSLRGKGFKSNASVFEDFKAGKYPKEGKTWQEEVMDYFKLEGKYDISIKHPGQIDLNGNISYNDLSFKQNYDHLMFNVDHETTHQKHILTGMYEGKEITPVMHGLEEMSTYLHNYYNQGLYPNHGYNDLVYRINSFGWNAMLEKDFERRWWHFIFTIPRRY